MIRQTSMNAYASVVSEGVEGRQCMIILNTLKSIREPLTFNEISTYAGVRLSSVTARVNYLVKQGLVVEAGKRKDRLTDRTNHVWTIKKGENYENILSELQRRNGEKSGGCCD